jgi:uncharacterized protein (TIGR03000 family)
MLYFVLLALLAQPGDTPPVPGAPSDLGMAPEQGVAVIDDKGTLTITRIDRGFGMMNAKEVWLKTPAKKEGEKVEVKAKVTSVQLTVVELPTNVVEAYTVDGKAIARAKLADMLAKERTALIALNGKKVEPFHLELYKEGTIVLVTPANLWRPDFFAYPIPGPNEGKPNGFPPKKPPQKPNGKLDTEQSADESPVSFSVGDQKGDAPPAARPAGIQAILRGRDKLPQSFPPTAADVTAKDGAIVITRQVVGHIPVAKGYTVLVVHLVPFAETIEVKVGDRLEKREVTKYKEVKREEKRVATFYEPIWVDNKTIAVKSIKGFVVNKDGKLDALAGAKLLDMIAKPTRVLVREGADVDPRHLELIRTGTIYLAFPKATAPEDGPPERPKGQYEEIPLPKGASRLDAKRSNGVATADIHVNLSFDVPLSIDGKKTASTGKRRVFTTPPLRLGQTFTYEFQASWPSGRTSTFRVNVQAQETTRVDVAEPKE